MPPWLALLGLATLMVALYLPYISPTSPLYLPCISPISRGGLVALASYTRSYTGVNCAGGAGSAWEADHGDAGCEIEGRYRGDVGEIEHGDAGCDSP